MIPKILHFIWVGGAPCPYLERLTAYRKLNPDWQINLWTDANLPPLICERVYNRIPVPTSKADILRLELLWRFGGVYVDIDSECRRPLVELLEECDMFFTTHRGGRKIEIGCMGAQPEHPVVGQLLIGLPKHFDELVAKLDGQLSVYWVYSYIRKQTKGAGIKQLPAHVSCLPDMATAKTYIVQDRANTFANQVTDSKYFKVV